MLELIYWCISISIWMNKKKRIDDANLFPDLFFIYYLLTAKYSHSVYVISANFGFPCDPFHSIHYHIISFYHLFVFPFHFHLCRVYLFLFGLDSFFSLTLREDYLWNRFVAITTIIEWMCFRYVSVFVHVCVCVFA